MKPSLPLQSDASFSELKLAEEAKRERNWDPALRWSVVQDTIAWAAEQATVRRNTPAACLANERRILEAMAKAAKTE
jgi:hypothetical protein